MRKKLEFMAYGILGAMLILLALGFASSAKAGPKQCPPGQDGQCSTYKHKITGKLGCFPDNANPQGWIFLYHFCPNNPRVEDTPNPTDPSQPIFPSPTIPKQGATATVFPVRTPHDPKPKIAIVFTPTPEQNCTNTGNPCLCLIVTQLAELNLTQRELLHLQATQNACTMP